MACPFLTGSGKPARRPAPATAFRNKSSSRNSSAFSTKIARKCSTGKSCRCASSGLSSGAKRMIPRYGNRFRTQDHAPSVSSISGLSRIIHVDSKTIAAPLPAGSGLNDDIGEDNGWRCTARRSRLRDAEQRAFDLFLQNLVKGTSHLSLGQEAIAAGFADGHGRRRLVVLHLSRPRPHTGARRADREGARRTDAERQWPDARQGRLHASDLGRARRDGLYAIIGAHLPIACGAAWRAQYSGDKDVSVCFFGDGTTNIGAFHEALNFAAVWKLPVVFVCENNLYMEYTPIGDVTAIPQPAADRAIAPTASSASSSTATTPTSSTAPRRRPSQGRGPARAPR